MRTLKSHMGLVLATSVLLSTAAFAQQPETNRGNEQRPKPKVETTAPAPSAPAATQTQTTAPSPTVQRSAPSATITQERSAPSATVTQQRSAPSSSVTVGRSDSRWDRSRMDRVRPAFAFISGPRIVVRPGWCRGLHRGWHAAPGMGSHAGTHRGLFRC